MIICNGCSKQFKSNLTQGSDYSDIFYSCKKGHHFCGDCAGEDLSKIIELYIDEAKDKKVFTPYDLCPICKKIEQSNLPNIERALKIEVEHDGERYRADAKLLPGTPVVGIGSTIDTAKFNLCVNLLYNIALSYSDRRDTTVYSDIVLEALRKDYCR